MKKVLLIIAIIGCVGMAFSFSFGTQYEPITPMQFLRLLADSDLSFDDSLITIQQMKDFLDREDTFEPMEKFKGTDADDEKGFLKQISTTLTAFFNYTVDFFVMIGYTFKLIILFLADAVQSIVSFITLLFKFVGLSPIT